MARSPEEYTRARDKYDPRYGELRRCRLLMIAESPPSSGYFYDDEGGTIGEGMSLFSETMTALRIWDGRAAQRRDLLKRFQDKGCFLLDLSYVPVDKLDGWEREEPLLLGIPKTVEKVRELQPEGIIIVKKPLYDMVRAALMVAGFDERILNRKPLAFPTSGNQGEFRRDMKPLIAKLFP